jgi:hypothetical protein
MEAKEPLTICRDVDWDGRDDDVSWLWGAPAAAEEVEAASADAALCREGKGKVQPSLGQAATSDNT